MRKVMFNVRLDKPLHEALMAAAGAQGVSATQTVREWVQVAVMRHQLGRSMRPEFSDSVGTWDMKRLNPLPDVPSAGPESAEELVASRRPRGRPRKVAGPALEDLEARAVCFEIVPPAEAVQPLNRGRPRKVPAPSR